jgi:hypothetical protein
VGQVGAGWSTFPVGAVVHPSTTHFPAIYGVNPELEPRGNELTRLIDVPWCQWNGPRKIDTGS